MINQISVQNHVAIIVPSVRKAVDYLRPFQFQIGLEEDFDTEGTREVYIEYGKKNSLLLMEPIKPGAYQRSLEKRGPGFHHFAIDVLNLETFIESISGSGWLLHPKTIQTIKKTKTAYLARPGFPGLIEVQEKSELFDDPEFISKIEMPFEDNLAKMLVAIGFDRWIRPSKESAFFIGDRKIPVKDLY